MAEHGVLFSPMMVRAIVADAKTVTRRVLEPQPEAPRAIYDQPDADTVVEPYRSDEYVPKVYSFNWRMTRLRNVAAPFCDGTTAVWTCPYGDPGDTLWVREAWSIATPARKAWQTTPVADVVYSSTAEVPAGWRRRHARFMPKRYARLWLVVDDVRVERLHAIDDADARTEGVAFYDPEHLGPDVAWPDGDPLTPREVFAHLWNRINGDTAPWSSNPWVWRIGFRRIERTEGRDAT